MGRHGVVRLFWLAMPVACLALPPIQAAAARAYDGSLYATRTEWHDESGSAVALDAWRGKTVALSFFYASCERTCDRTFAWMRRLAERFEAADKPVELVLVTLDPGHDTVERLAVYKHARALGAHWHLLTGTVEQTRRLASDLDFEARHMDGHILHDFRIFVLDDEGRVAEIVEWHTSVDELIERMNVSKPPSG